MIEENGLKYFGLFDDKTSNCKPDDYPSIDPAIKDLVVKHIEDLDPALTSGILIDIYTGEEIPDDVLDKGMYEDMGYAYPTQILYYIKKYDMGIPPEYIELIIGETNG